MVEKIRPKAVIDTNIFLAGLLNEFAVAAKLINFFKNDYFNLLISEEIFEEYNGVILEFRNKVLTSDAEILFSIILERAVLTKPTEKIDVCRDTDDNKFIECALAGKADYIVTKNIKHFPHKEYRGIKILKIRDFLKVIEN